MTDKKTLLLLHLNKLHIECHNQSKVFWNYFSVLSHYDSLLGIPTIVLSSITSLSALTNLSGKTENNFINALNLLTPLLAITSTILASLNQYLRYSERAQKAKNQAKMLSEIGRRIQYTKTKLDAENTDLSKLTDDIYKELDIFGREMEELPQELRSILHSISIQEETEVQSLSHNLNTTQISDEL